MSNRTLIEVNPEEPNTLEVVLQMKLSAAEKAIARLKDEIAAERQKSARLLTWVNSLIAAAPQALRSYITSRLDGTGGGYVPDGLWNYVLQRTTP